MTHRGALLFWAGMLAALGAGWAGFPRLIYRRQPQPVAFSHKIHAENAGMKCEDCHEVRTLPASRGSRNAPAATLPRWARRPPKNSSSTAT